MHVEKYTNCGSVIQCNVIEFHKRKRLNMDEPEKLKLSERR